MGYTNIAGEPTAVTKKITKCVTLSSRHVLWSDYRKR